MAMKSGLRISTLFTIHCIRCASPIPLLVRMPSSLTPGRGLPCLRSKAHSGSRQSRASVPRPITAPEFKHGPLVTEAMPLAPNNTLLEKLKSNMQARPARAAATGGRRVRSDRNWVRMTCAMAAHHPRCQNRVRRIQSINLYRLFQAGALSEYNERPSAP